MTDTLDSITYKISDINEKNDSKIVHVDRLYPYNGKPFRNTSASRLQTKTQPSPQTDWALPCSEVGGSQENKYDISLVASEKTRRPLPSDSRQTRKSTHWR